MDQGTLSNHVHLETPPEDDPDQYMMLVPAAKKRPVLQLLCGGLAAILAIIGLSMDELSDGDVKFTDELSDEDFLDEIDYDCEDTGDDSTSHWAYEQYIYNYKGSFCENRDEFIDQDFCDESASHGNTWLVCGIMGTICFVASLPAVWFRGKASYIYVICVGVGILLLSIGSLNWLFNDKCEDIEDWPEEEATFDTTIGPSLVLAFVSIFCAIIGVLVSSIHLIRAPARSKLNPHSHEAQLAEVQKEQQRVQTHIVN